MTPEILARLADLLRDTDRYGRRRAAEAVGKIGSAAATPKFLARLADLLRDTDRYVRRAAADAVGKLGNAAATPEILARLADLLRDPHEREEAAHAVGGMMAQGVRIFKRPHGKWQGQSVAELSR